MSNERRRKDGPKRDKYTSQACLECQRRKVKCSGDPVCSSCRTRSIHCYYAGDGHKEAKGRKKRIYEE
ncbi:hypothetical protein BO83DRAFT_378582 [Aspergillus eucalypticola CBS 122712]|uniref:Zn(2)-C6 fungal-type domain-containing protein n=1 Tax=Aspergillus eucalypticola (strain CBS 122712 / IBT 29274) TaxID=1448314 RepID=A0A317VHC4_ASPEC|nr:uncharacterized protein BO83DRAFT_378582 [Aspergillus eucalypticola CBS 122712]PWY72571.1 hypothetical protein BO83DRAFT_378582 [Aspergillus eucalypticola CBS 122712]